MKKYFLVYDDETKWFALQRNNLLNSVKKFSDFETISFKKSEIDKDFLEKNKHIFQIPVGDGAWLWKPYIIDKTLEKLNDGDLLFYMDANYYFLEEFENLYKKLIEERDILIWKNKPNEQEYSLWHLCHKHVLEKYGMLEKLYGNDEAKEPWAGTMLIKKTNFSTNLIKEWLDMSQIKKDLWGDEESFKVQNREYTETRRPMHRPNQALLGILLYKYNIPIEHMEKKYLQNVRNPW
jgi:hypothetical protein